MQPADHYDVVIIGAGLAGLALSRQLLLYSNKKILLVDKRTEIPPKKQKVGESTVQVSAYYYAKVLDLEEHLQTEHFVKYNLRYYWKTPGKPNDCFEHYSHAFIQKFSNIWQKVIATKKSRTCSVLVWPRCELICGESMKNFMSALALRQ